MATPVYGGPDGEYHSGVELLERTQNGGWAFLVAYEDCLVLASPQGEERFYYEIPESELPDGVSVERGEIVDE